MNNELKKAAEILVARGWDKQVIADPFYKANDHTGNNMVRECIARRQADTIEDWLNNKQPCLWQSIGIKDAELYMQNGYVTSAHKWRLDRIRWCLQQLGESDVR